MLVGEYIQPEGRKTKSAPFEWTPPEHAVNTQTKNNYFLLREKKEEITKQTATKPRKSCWLRWQAKQIKKSGICYKTKFLLSRLAIVLNVSSVILKAVMGAYSIHLIIKGPKEALTAHQRGLFLEPWKKNSPGEG